MWPILMEWRDALEALAYLTVDHGEDLIAQGNSPIYCHDSVLHDRVSMVQCDFVWLISESMATSTGGPTHVGSVECSYGD